MEIYKQCPIVVHFFFLSRPLTLLPPVIMDVEESRSSEDPVVNGEGEVKRKLSSRSHRSRPRSRSRSPKRPRKEFTMHDTTLFAEMRKKRHLREKIDARKSHKRDEFDEHSVNPEGRKSSSSSEKGTCCCCYCYDF